MTKILIVEDNAELGELLVERLKRRGHFVLLAAEPAEAIAGAKASRPDVILLESQLRGDADWSTARALKFDELTRDIPVIALMANNSDEMRALARQNGCDELHAKPIDFGRLLQQIDAAAAADDDAQAP
ncbi:MAG TPA: response regulator [Roseiarcus sp.]|nr:response regulator [Roseiarcus sp.]